MREQKKKSSYVPYAVLLPALYLAFIAINRFLNPVPHFCGDGPIVEYAVENLPQRVRSLKMTDDGLFIGPSGQNQLRFYNGDKIEMCQSGDLKVIGHTNVVLQDAEGNDPTQDVMAGTDGNGAYYYDRSRQVWVNHTTATSRIPDDRVYGGDVGPLNGFFITTYNGETYFSAAEQDWRSPLTESGQPTSELREMVASLHLHDIYVEGNLIFIGHIDDGLTIFYESDVQRITATDLPEILGSDNVRVIEGYGDEIWVGTDVGDEQASTTSGLSMYNKVTRAWTQYLLPDNRVNDIDFDQYGRPWVSTRGGVFYFENGNWVSFASTQTLALEFGCEGCTLGPDQVFYGGDFGLQQATVPAPSS